MGVMSETVFVRLVWECFAACGVAPGSATPQAAKCYAASGKIGGVHLLRAYFSPGNLTSAGLWADQRMDCTTRRCQLGLVQASLPWPKALYTTRPLPSS